MIVAGIDPGAMGGLAVWDSESGEVSTHKLHHPRTDMRKLAELVRDILRPNPDAWVYIELNTGTVRGSMIRPPQAFVMGEAAGGVRAAAELSVPAGRVVLVPAVIWQKAVCPQARAAADYRARKQILKIEAKRLFGPLAINQTADALLIMVYGKNEQKNGSLR